jgi:hypothetical protein
MRADEGWKKAGRTDYFQDITNVNGPNTGVILFVLTITPQRKFPEKHLQIVWVQFNFVLG